MEENDVLEHKQTRCTYDALNEVITISDIKITIAVCAEKRSQYIFLSRNEAHF